MGKLFTKLVNSCAQCTFGYVEAICSFFVKHTVTSTALGATLSLERSEGDAVTEWEWHPCLLPWEAGGCSLLLEDLPGMRNSSNPLTSPQGLGWLVGGVRC